MACNLNSSSHRSLKLQQVHFLQLNRTAHSEHLQNNSTLKGREEYIIISSQMETIIPSSGVKWKYRMRSCPFCRMIGRDLVIEVRTMPGCTAKACTPVSPKCRRRSLVNSTCAHLLFAYAV